MPFDTGRIPANIIDAVKHRCLIPLIGAGISKQSTQDFPTWNELIDFLLAYTTERSLIDDNEANEMKDLLQDGKILMVAQALASSMPAHEYLGILEKRFNPKGAKPSEAHKLIFKLKPPLIMTTNYDRLLEDAYSASTMQAANVYTYAGAPQVQRQLHILRALDRPIIFKLHGSIDEPGEIILTEQDYRALIYTSPGYRMVLSTIFLSNVVLMLGFSASDREIMLILENIREALKRQSSPDYIFLPDNATGKVQRKRLREDFGVEVIPYTASPDHREVTELLQHLTKFTPKIIK